MSTTQTLNTLSIFQNFIQLPVCKFYQNTRTKAVLIYLNRQKNACLHMKQYMLLNIKKWQSCRKEKVNINIPTILPATTTRTYRIK